MADLDLVAGNARLTLDTQGGGMRALVVGGWEILDAYPEGTRPIGSRGQVLAPWPNRVFKGRYTWAGRDHQLVLNDGRGVAAMHGFVREVEWSVEESGGATATLSTAVPQRPGYPFDVSVSLRYELGETGLEVRATAVNHGTDPAPFGIGMHPYLDCGGGADGTSLTLPRCERLVPDGDEPSTRLEQWDARVGVIGDRRLDDAFRCTDSPVVPAIEISGPAGSLSLELGRSFRWFQVYTADGLPGDDRRGSVAVEPMTCPPHAFVTSSDVIALEPGAAWQDAWSLRWLPARDGYQRG